jgi:hypothetical protein
LDIEWDDILVARKVLGSVLPDTARKGEQAAIVYRIGLEVGPEDYGVDLLQLGAIVAIEGIRFHGVDLGYEWQADDVQGRTEIRIRQPLKESGTLEIAGRALFLQDRTAIPVAVGNQAQATADGYVNWQNAAEAPEGTWTVQGIGAPPRLLGEVAVAPRPFSPYRDEQAEFRFVVGNLQQATEVSLEIFNLTGTSIRRLVQIGGARAYHLDWDGRDHDGRMAAPGLYLYEIRVDAEDNAASRTGTLVVAY